MKKKFTLLIAVLFGTAMLLFGQTPHKLGSVTEGFVIYWLIDSPEDLIWLTDTLNMDPDNDGIPDFDSLGAKWDANYRLTADIVFDPDSSKVDWNNDGTVDLAGSSDSIGLFSIGDWPSAPYFSGTFDGQYHSIDNIYNWDQNRGALFGNFGGAQVENLRLLNMRVYSKQNYCGGIVGRASVEPAVGDNNVIKRCWVEGSFIYPTNLETNLYSGGIAGRFQFGEISECVSKVTAVANIANQRRFGGIVGMLQGAPSIKDCYSIANITAKEQLGGLFGMISVAPEATLENCYGVAELTGTEPPDERGGFAGNIGSLVSTSCYWDKDVDTIGCGGGDSIAVVAVVGLATADFATEANFVDWDFTNTWKIGDVDGVQRPYLQWQDLVGYVAVTGVSLDMNSLNIAVGETGALVATVAPEDASDDSVTWTTANAEVATVDNGTVTGVDVGAAYIYVTTVDGNFMDSCLVTVSWPIGIKNPENPSYNIYPNPASDILTVSDAPLGSEYKMINLMGQIVRSGLVNNKTMRINIQDCRKGVYLLKIENKVNKIMIK